MSVTCGIVSFRTSMDENGKEFTVYGIEVHFAGQSWTLEKRYSEFHSFNQAISDISRGMHNKFPRKKMGSLSQAQTEERKEQLAEFFDELMTLDLSMEVRTVLNDFLEVNAHKGPSSSSSSSSSSQGEGKEEKQDSSNAQEEEGDSLTWDPNDPLGGMVRQQAAKKEKKKQQRQQHKKEEEDLEERKTMPLGSSTTRSTPLATSRAPTFMGSSRNKHYEPTVLGFRDALKEKAPFSTIQQLLRANPDLATEVDNAGQSMLHLACIFDQTEAALLLVRMGADANLSNREEETPIALALPLLKKKIQKCVEEMESEGQEEDGSEGED